MGAEEATRLRARVQQLEAAGKEAAAILKAVLQAYEENRMVRSILTPAEIEKVITSLEAAGDCVCPGSD